MSYRPSIRPLPGDDYRKYNEAALPRWAQDYLRLLRMRLTEAYDKIDEITDCPETRVWSGREYSQIETSKRVYLSEKEPVFFRTAGGTIECKLRSSAENLRDPVLLIRGDDMTIRPRFGNEIEIR